MDWRVMMPNQVSIWLIHDEPTGVKWKWTCGFFASHAFTSGVLCVGDCLGVSAGCGQHPWPFGEEVA
jgi:hypothetical protein